MAKECLLSMNYQIKTNVRAVGTVKEVSVDDEVSWKIVCKYT